MIIPGIGEFTKHERFDDWYLSDSINVPVLGQRPSRFIFCGYDDDSAQHDFVSAITNFLSIDETALKRAEQEVFFYYQDCISDLRPEDDGYVHIDSPAEVWKHVQLGIEPSVSRRPDDNLIYISLECECDWEPEHGLLIVFKNGLEINKVGSFDGHLTNSDAYDFRDFENVVYVKRSDMLRVFRGKIL